MTLDTLTADAPTPDAPTPDAPTPDAPQTVETAAGKPAKAPGKRGAGRKTKTLELTLSVTGTADGEWHAELRQGSSYLVRNLPVAAAAVSRAAKELHADLATPIDEVIEEARSQQAARVAALEAELEAARKVLADLD
jgi:hypothetical protein